MGRRPLVRRRWHRGSPFPAHQGIASPGPATASVAATVPASIKDSARSRRAPRAFRRSHEAAALPRPDVTYSRPMPAWRIRLDSPLPPEMRRHGASVPTSASPHAIRDTWHRGSRGTSASPAASYGYRARAGLPPTVCRPVCRASPPDNVAAGPQIDGVRLHPAPRRHQKRMFSSLAAASRNADLAPRHYRIAATAISTAQSFATLCNNGGSDGAHPPPRCLVRSGSLPIDTAESAGTTALRPRVRAPRRPLAASLRRACASSP